MQPTEPPPRRLWLALAGAAAIVIVMVAAGFSALWTGLGPCGGDGGSPYAAPASPAGRYCESPIPAASWVAGIALAVAGTVVAMWRRRWPLLGGFAAAGLAVALSPLLAGLLPDRCSDDTESRTADELQRYLRDRPECGHY